MGLSKKESSKLSSGFGILQFYKKPSKDGRSQQLSTYLFFLTPNVNHFTFFENSLFCDSYLPAKKEGDILTI